MSTRRVTTRTDMSDIVSKRILLQQKTHNLRDPDWSEYLIGVNSGRENDIAGRRQP